VRLDWRPPSRPLPNGVKPLRLLAVDRADSDPAPQILVVGELLRTHGGAAIAFVSIARAQRLVVAAGVPARHHDDTLGRVLGRAAAHEIGHYLLDTATHSDEGLMRARFDALEFSAALSGEFRLDDHASTWLRQRLATGALLGPQAMTQVVHGAMGSPVRFSYLGPDRLPR
jgi:hypothetical protein